MKKQETLQAVLEISTEIEKLNGFRGEIDNYIRVVGSTIPDVSSPDAEKLTRQMRSNGVTLKNDIKKKQQAINGKLQASMSAIKTISGSLQAEVISAYAPHDEAIKELEREAKERSEKRKADKLEAERVERERVAVIAEKISSIERVALNAATESINSHRISELIEKLKILDTSTGFSEFSCKANTVKIATIAHLSLLLSQRITQEETALAQAEEVLRLEKQRQQLQDRIDKQKADEAEEALRLEKQRQQLQDRIDKQKADEAEALDRHSQQLQEEQKERYRQNQIATKKAQEEKRIAKQREAELKRREEKIACKEQEEKLRIQKIKDDLEKVEAERLDEERDETYVYESINDLTSNLGNAEYKDLIDVVRAGRIRHIEWIG